MTHGDQGGTTVEGTDRHRYDAIRGLTEAIAAPLSAEDQTAQSMPDVSPTKWHRAHTTWFFEEFVLGPNAAGYEPFHPGFRYLFNSYYEAVGARHPQWSAAWSPAPASPRWPTTATTSTRPRALIDDGVLDRDPALAALVKLGLHHEQQHQELALMDIKHVLSRNALDPIYRPRADRPGGAEPSDGDGQTDPTGPAPLGWIEHPGGLVEVGWDGNGFAFDNEGPRHTVHLTPFAIADRPVTNAEVLEFMADGGYRRPELWLSDGWATVQAQGWDAPLYWRHEGGDEWSTFTLAGRRPVDPTEPACHLSHYEADAIAQWAGARLPTEAEWEAIAAKDDPADADVLDLDVLHPLASGRMFGDVWEWTASAYLPYPGFRAASGAVGEYNGKFMVNQHVLRGGCCATPPGHVRATYRNFFPSHARWAFSGARLARHLEA
ncbi:MAG: ergothioneine biosynthesis protein EgtB [Acidimicrobiales bacterium]